MRQHVNVTPRRHSLDLLPTYIWQIEREREKELRVLRRSAQPEICPENRHGHPKKDQQEPLAPRGSPGGLGDRKLGVTKMVFSLAGSLIQGTVPAQKYVYAYNILCIISRSSSFTQSTVMSHRVKKEIKQVKICIYEHTGDLSTSVCPGLLYMGAFFSC